MTVEPVAKFEVGSTYTATSPCDQNAVWAFTVVRRTVKFLHIVETAELGSGALDSVDSKCVGIKTNDSGVEFALPLGKFSMAPVITADRPAAPSTIDEAEVEHEFPIPVVVPNPIDDKPVWAETAEVVPDVNALGAPTSDLQESAIASIVFEADSLKKIGFDA